MGQYTSYYLYQKYEKRGDQDWIPCYPNIYSISGDSENPMPLAIKEENDKDCGYICDEIERWVEIPITEDYICDDCEVGFETRCNTTSAFTYYGDYRYEVLECQYRYELENGNWSEWMDMGTKYGNPQKVAKKAVFEMNSGEVLEVSCGDDYGNYSPTLSENENFTSRYTIQYEYYPQVVEDGYTHFCNGYMNPHIQGCGCYEPKPLVVSSITVGDCVENVEFNYVSGLQEMRLSPSVKSYWGPVGKRLYVDTLTQWLNMNLRFYVASSPNYTTLYVNNVATTNIVIPSGITSIKDYTFANFNVTSVTIPNTVTQIGNASFWNCSLSSLTIPNSVESIGEGTFTMANNSDVTVGTGLTSMYCNSIQGNSMTISFYSLTPPTIISTNNCSSVDFGHNPTIYVPSGSVDYYKSEWSHYEYNIFPIGGEDEYRTVATYKVGNVSHKVYNGLSGDTTTFSADTEFFDNCYEAYPNANEVILSEYLWPVYTHDYQYQYTGTFMDGSYDKVTIECKHAIGYFSATTKEVVVKMNYTNAFIEKSFNNCGLENFTLESGDTAISLSDSFKNNTSLTSVTINRNVTFGGTAFGGSTNLEDVYFNCSEPPKLYASAAPFINCKIGMKIHVPCELYNLYMEDPWWKDFNIVKNSDDCTPIDPTPLFEITKEEWVYQRSGSTSWYDSRGDRVDGYSKSYQSRVKDSEIIFNVKNKAIMLEFDSNYSYNNPKVYKDGVEVEFTQSSSYPVTYYYSDDMREDYTTHTFRIVRTKETYSESAPAVDNIIIQYQI